VTLVSLSEVNEDVQRRILEFLLLAREVEVSGPNSEAALTKYEFSLAVLQTCKDLHALGIELFQSNHFDLVSTTLPSLATRVIRRNIYIRPVERDCALDASLVSVYLPTIRRGGRLFT
jgi:hypothetical protein